MTIPALSSVPVHRNDKCRYDCSALWLKSFGVRENIDPRVAQDSQGPAAQAEQAAEKVFGCHSEVFFTEESLRGLDLDPREVLRVGARPRFERSE